MILVTYWILKAWKPKYRVDFDLISLGIRIKARIYGATLRAILYRVSGPLACQKSFWLAFAGVNGGGVGGLGEHVETHGCPSANLNLTP